MYVGRTRLPAAAKDVDYAVNLDDLLQMRKTVSSEGGKLWHCHSIKPTGSRQYIVSEVFMPSDHCE